MTHRLTYIDTTRAILITLVVLGHVLNYANPQYNIIPYTLAQEWIGAFHMPAFFVLSGLLTDGEKWRGRFWCRICFLSASRSCISISYCILFLLQRGSV